MWHMKKMFKEKFSLSRFYNDVNNILNSWPKLNLSLGYDGTTYAQEPIFFSKLFIVNEIILMKYGHEIVYFSSAHSFY